LKRYADAHASSDWPHPLVALYLGEATPEAVLAAAKVDDARKTAGNLCEAHFYLAQLHRLRGDETLAVSHFESCLATGMERYNEFRMAREELKKPAGR
jgi:lipoprotein NlpI